MHIVRTDLEIQREPFVRPFAIEPAGKSLSLAPRMVRAAAKAVAGCVPLLIQWTKDVAARQPS